MSLEDGPHRSISGEQQTAQMEQSKLLEEVSTYHGICNTEDDLGEVSLRKPQTHPRRKETLDLLWRDLQLYLPCRALLVFANLSDVASDLEVKKNIMKNKGSETNNKKEASPTTHLPD